MRTLDAGKPSIVDMCSLLPPPRPWPVQTTIEVETLLRLVNEDDLKPAVANARRVFEEPPNTIKVAAGRLLLHVYDRYKDSDHGGRVGGLTRSLASGQPPMGRRMVEDVLSE